MPGGCKILCRDISLQSDPGPDGSKIRNTSAASQSESEFKRLDTDRAESLDDV